MTVLEAMAARDATNLMEADTALPPSPSGSTPYGRLECVATLLRCIDKSQTQDNPTTHIGVKEVEGDRHLHPEGVTPRQARAVQRLIAQMRGGGTSVESTTAE